MGRLWLHKNLWYAHGRMVSTMNAKTHLMNRLAIIGFVAFLGTPAFSCTCVWTTKPPVDFGASVVFRGTVTDRKLMPARAEMKRGRYEITFRVDEVWKGSRQRTIVLYGVDDGTDCMGGSSYEVGKNYLVFASEQSSQDVSLDGTKLWFGWTDVLPKGTPMLVPTACSPSGEISEIFVKDALNQLGKGSPPTEDK
jgi:hypothetical protein